MSDTEMWQVICVTGPVSLDEIDDVLTEALDPPLSYTLFPDPSGGMRIEAYYDHQPDGFPIDGDLTISEMEQRDWVAESQAALPAIRIGRLHIRGGFDQAPPLPYIDLVVEAGQAFGTGRHESTSGCLHLLQQILRTRSVKTVLDVGTGAGILGIAAARLAPVSVIGSDIDPIAVRVAVENAALNKVPHATRWVTAPGTRHPLIQQQGPYDLVFANILAGPLVSMAGDISAQVAPGGSLVLAGLLNVQENWVLGRYRAAGLQVAECWRKNGWSAVHLIRSGGR